MPSSTDAKPAAGSDDKKPAPKGATPKIDKPSGEKKRMLHHTSGRQGFEASPKPK